MTDLSPDWVHDALHQFADELRFFVRTTVDVTLHPVRFAQGWVSGRRRALNPLGFLATAFAVLGPTLAVTQRLTQYHDEPSSPWLDALGALLPFVYYLVLGALQHGVLRLNGSRRRLRESCAMALYVAGGPGLLAQLLVIALVLFVHYRYGVTDMLQVPSGVKWALVTATLAPFVLLYVWLGLTLAGLHRAFGIRGWQVVAANVIALAVTAFLFAVLNPPGHYGLHFYFGPRFSAGGWHRVIGATF